MTGGRCHPRGRSWSGQAPFPLPTPPLSPLLQSRSHTTRQVSTSHPAHQRGSYTTPPSLPVSAFYAESPLKKICIEGYVYTQSRFLGLSLGVHNIGKGGWTANKAVTPMHYFTPPHPSPPPRPQSTCTC